jgi:rhamnose utilization protein RhaD (predicted bifunctional aldolase and dehydrogenase)
LNRAALLSGTMRAALLKRLLRMDELEIRERLTQLAHEIGREDRRLAILAEGNVSADLGDGTFLVKASGSQLGTLRKEDFTRVRMASVLVALDTPDLPDEQVRQTLEASRCDLAAKLPSIETFLHALCLQEGGAKWVGHAHPEGTLGILCSKAGAQPFMRHIFPDAIVVCGRHLCVVPYFDPGLRLAVAMRGALREHIRNHASPPKVILMLNHGPVVLGQSEREVLNTILMLEKWARILLETATFGGPQFLDETLSDRIEHRPDEHHRRRFLGGQSRE